MISRQQEGCRWQRMALIDVVIPELFKADDGPDSDAFHLQRCRDSPLEMQPSFGHGLLLSSLYGGILDRIIEITLTDAKSRND
ncbi:hypothetical protein L2E82_46931 [Cichorium intybus]|uniref:Uncharacterized protein n=1 Tax=Cichorium intybus TaxID=13427 RepID=A0ACB8YU25_CICIN|nr:hypothetical protein L2E82_46931 [Cichorium intybus]